jgi:hypothetical protein
MMKKFYIKTEIFVLLMLFSLDIINYIYILMTGYYLGDFKGMTVHLNNDFLFFGILIQLISYCLLFFLYEKFKVKEEKKSSIINKLKYFDLFVFLYLILNIYVAYKYNFGRIIVGKSDTFILSTLFNTWNIEIIFYIYYISYQKNKYFKAFNVILFSLLNLYQASIGFIWVIFLISLMKYYKKRIDIKKIFLFYGAILLGAYIYKLIYPLRLLIRFGFKTEIEYIQALGNLISRISPINNLYNIFELGDNLINNINFLTIDYSEILGFFRRIVPPNFMNKDFYVINDVFMFTKNNNYEITGSFDTTLLGKLYLLINKNFIEFILYIIFIFITLLIFRLFLKKLGGKNLNIYFFITLVGLFNSGSIEVSISLRLFVVFSLYITIKLLLLLKESILKEQNHIEETKLYNKELTDK